MGDGPRLVAARNEEERKNVTPERWQEVKKVLAGALERAPEREACLSRSGLRRTGSAPRSGIPHRRARTSDNRVSWPQPAVQTKELAIGARLGAYEILARIGAGGMGDVYRARDTKLGRSVAIKVLPPEFVDDPERLARFQREARMLASLNHPNIVTIHSFEEAGGVHFLTMELVEGQPLNRLDSEGRPSRRSNPGYRRRDFRCAGRRARAKASFIGT